MARFTIRRSFAGYEALNKVRMVHFNGRAAPITLLLLILLNLTDSSWSASPECSKLKEDLPNGIQEYALSLKEDFIILGMALDELLPFGHAYEAETVLTKARDLLIEDNWAKVNSRHYLERLSGGAKQEGGHLLAGAINLFHSLRDCLYHCNYASSLSLAANYIAAFESELYPTDDDRLKGTILRVVELHRELCLPSYLEQFRSLRSNPELDSMKKLDTILDSELVGKILAEQGIAEASSVYINDKLLKLRSELFDRVAILANNTEEAKYISAKKSGTGWLEYMVRAEFRTKTVANLVIEPCRKFVRQFRDVFYPMRVDQILMDSTSSIEEKKPDSMGNDPMQDGEFMSFWTKYRLCKELSIDRVRFADLIAGEVPYKLGLIEHQLQTPAAQLPDGS